MPTTAVATEYALLDCGAGRRLERFGQLVLDRRAPAALQPPRLDPAAWSVADGRYDRAQGDLTGWTWASSAPESWPLTLDQLTFELRPAAGGQVGLFPEQRPMWAWIRAQVAAASSADRPEPEVLNLFAYTGGSTLAAAQAGARVTHVDGARGAIAWGRRNVEASGLGDRPIRWLADDVETYVRRELRRDRRYDGVILDPPAFGRGARGRSWRLADRLATLLADVARLVSERNGFVLLTAHAADLPPDRLRAALVEAVERPCESGPLGLVAGTGAHLPLGAFARVAWGRR